MSEEQNVEEVPPLEDGPTVPSDERPFLGIPGTLLQGFGPVRHAPALARSSALRPAVLFALLIGLPLTLASGVIPYTHLLTFGFSFSVTVREGNIALDVLRAMGLALIAMGASYCLLGAAFVSLCGAFGRSREGAASPSRAALRTVLYRSWLAPFSSPFGLGAMLTMWALPTLDGFAEYVFLAAMLVPFILLFISLHAAARHAAGCTPGMSLVVTLVPVLLFLLAQGLLVGDPPGSGVLEPLMPHPPEGQSAPESTPDDSGSEESEPSPEETPDWADSPTTASLWTGSASYTTSSSS
ncbi:MAG: hypothetical protein ACI9KE_000489 [Polyangiales bacterium]|jgi:hypothetical protein